MEHRKYPETFDIDRSPFKKACKKAWLNLVAALFCFTSACVDILTSIKGFTENNISSGVASVVFAVILLLVATINLWIWISVYKKFKNQVD